QLRGSRRARRGPIHLLARWRRHGRSGVVLEDSIGAQAGQVLPVLAVCVVAPQGQLCVRAPRELRKGSGRASAGLQRLPAGAGHRAGHEARDARPSARQPDAAGPRQAAVQRADERGRLHAPGDPASVKTRALALALAVWSAGSAAPAAAQTFSYRGFVDLRGLVFPQDSPQEDTHFVGDALARGEVFYNPTTWVQVAFGLDARANSDNQVDPSVRLDVRDRLALRPSLSLRRLSATLTRGPLTTDVGKQFIRWGKTDVITPTDRFAPK